MSPPITTPNGLPIMVPAEARPVGAASISRGQRISGSRLIAAIWRRKFASVLPSAAQCGLRPASHPTGVDIAGEDEGGVDLGQTGRTDRRRAAHGVKRAASERAFQQGAAVEQERRFAAAAHHGLPLIPREQNARRAHFAQ